MRTQNRIFTTVVLVIFVLCHIIPLHKAISHCVDGNVYKTVEDLDQLYKDRFEAVKQAEDTLKEKENNDLLGSAASNAFILGKTGLIFGLISSLASGNPLPMAIGYAAGVTAGTIAAIRSHYKAIDDAKKALEKAETDLDHAKKKLDEAKQSEADAKQAKADAAIQPGESQISVYQTHTISISTDAIGIPIKNVNAYFIPQDLTDPMSDSMPFALDTGNFSSNVYSTTLSHSFSSKDKGLHSVSVTIYLIDGTALDRSYQILVTD